MAEPPLEYGQACELAFNHGGTLLASGLETGYIVIWDFETRGVALVFQAHALAVRSLACAPMSSWTLLTLFCRWTRGGQYLISGSKDRVCRVWDLKRLEDDSPALVSEAVMPAEIVQVVAPPGHSYLFFVSKRRRYKSRSPSFTRSP